MAGLYLRNQDNARLSALLVILTGAARLQVRACCRAVLLFIVICVDCLLCLFGDKADCCQTLYIYVNK